MNTRQENLASELTRLIGSVPSDADAFRHRMRLHQGWWRAFVLGMRPGPRPAAPNATACNILPRGVKTSSAFLDDAAIAAIQDTIIERQCQEGRGGKARGMIDEQRLFGNLLSSQPLCFNFFGQLKTDPHFASDVLQRLIDGVKLSTAVRFEFAPPENFTEDNSAFDVAFQFETTDGKKGLFGLECKFTDTFSAKKYDRRAYQRIFAENRETFSKPYESYLTSRYNQLFRNQLIAESMVQNRLADTVTTGLFCHPDDVGAQQIGKEFQGMLRDGVNRFRVITYMDYISLLQRMDLSCERREWTMLLWARYMGVCLSEVAATAAVTGSVDPPEEGG